MKKQSIETLETCKLSSSNVCNILGGETCGDATEAGIAQCGPEVSARCFYSSDQYTWDCADPNGTITQSFNWGVNNDVSLVCHQRKIIDINPVFDKSNQFEAKIIFYQIQLC